MESPPFRRSRHGPHSRSRTVRRSDFVIPSFAGNLARPSICQLRHTRRSIFRTKGRYYESQQATVRVNHPMNRIRISIQRTPGLGRAHSIVSSRFSRSAELIRTESNRIEHRLPLNHPEETRKNLKKPETLDDPIPCKTLGTRSSGVSGKKVHRKPESVSSARISSHSANAVPVLPTRRSRDPAYG